MRKNINTENIEGYLYQHSLEERKVENQQSENFGKSYIRGSIDIAVDEEGLNVLTTYYTYVTETTKSGQPNRSYSALKKIIDGGKTWVNDGKENAMVLRLTPSAALNDFYPQGQDEVVSQQRNEGGFVTILSGANQLVDNSKNERNKFTFDALITNVQHIDADEEKGVEEHDIIRCAIFNFRNDILPFNLVARSEDAMKYFEGLGATPAEPVYIKVWGKIVSTVIKVTKTEESAFGEAAVDTVERTVREWVLTGASTEPYAFGEEEVMTGDEVKKALQDRQVRLAEIKKRSDEYYANKGTTQAAAAAPVANAIPQGEFKF